MTTFLQANGLLILFLSFFVIGYFWLRTRPTKIGSLAVLDERISNSTPSILEFYSNF